MWQVCTMARHFATIKNMSINTKLVLLLTLAVGAVMFTASFLSLWQHEASLEGAMRDELRAHAITLKIALEENYLGGRSREAQKLIDRLRDNTKVYAVLLFDEKKNLLALSQPATAETFRHPPELESALSQNSLIEFIREVNGKKFVSVILPMRIEGDTRGAIELIKPLALIEADVFRARLSWASTTLLLLAVIYLIVFLVLRQGLGQPISSLLVGTKALGKGDLLYRVGMPRSKDEFAQLAKGFNWMADKLVEQREAVQRETENRLSLERELRHNERLALVGRLAAGIAHELGAPLNVIDARAEQILSKQNLSPEKRDRNLQIIRSNAERIANLVRQLLTLSRPYHLRCVNLSLADSLRSAIEQVEQHAKSANVKIYLETDANFTVTADRDYLHQVWLNILTNAIQAMPKGGDVKIECSQQNRNGQDFVKVKITDTGEGIATEHLDKIFDPFYTTKDIGQGTGLGLAVTRRIIEEHGGTIEAENNENSGASFTIYLKK
jgi:signal transduction histidine kinase